MATKRKKAETINPEAELQLEVMKREAEEAAHKIRIEAARQSLIDFRDNLPKYDLRLLHEDDNWFFIVENTHYILNPLNKTYCTWKPGRGGNSGRSYNYRSCDNLMETIKLFFWEYKGIEILPQIEIIPLLKKSGKSMQSIRVYK